MFSFLRGFHFAWHIMKGKQIATSLCWTQHHAKSNQEVQWSVNLSVIS